MMRMAILSPNVIFRARVNQASFTYPLAQVTFDTVTVGAYTDVEIGQTVIFGSTLGSDDLGRQRVRGATSTVLKFGRSSQGGHDGEVNLADDCFIEVWEDYRVWAKAQFIDTDTGEVFKDWDIAYVDQTEESPPVANAGADTAGTINAGTGVLRVQLPGVADTSFPTADLVAIASHQWTLPSGVALVGGYALTDAVIQVDCDPGFHHIKHSVTDDNGKQHAAYVKVYARDPDADTSITDFQIDSHRITPAGQQLSVRVLADIPASTYPDGTAVMIWEGEPSSVTDRSHMLFTGWHHTDPSRLLAERTGVIKEAGLDLVDVCGKLATLPGFDQTVEHNAAPSTWLEMKDANMDKYYHYLLHWHSTALVVADFTWSNQGSLFPFVVLGSPEQNLFGQVSTRAQSFVPNHVFVCNTNGQMAIKPDPMLQQTADRTTTIQATLTSADYTSLDYVHQRAPRFHWLREEAILTSNTQIAPIFSIAPGDAPGQGENPIPHGEQLARSQDDLNECAGHRYRRINAPQTPFTVGLLTTHGIEPAAMTWVKLTIAANEATQRGLTFTEARGLPLELNITYQYERTGMVRNVALLWERETAGNIGGVTYTLPTAPPPTQTTPPPYNPTTPPTSQGDGFGTNYVLVAATLGRTRDLSAASPAWVDISPTDANDFYDFVLDPHSPLTTGYLTSNSGVWKSTDLDLASPSWSLVLTAATVTTALSASTFGEVYHVLCSINFPDYVAVFFAATTGGVKKLYCGRSFDGGSTWAYSLVYTPVGAIGLAWTGAADYVPHQVGGAVRLYAGFGDAAINLTAAYVIRSDDSGATWGTPVNIAGSAIGDFPVPATVHVPFTNNPSGDTVYLGVAGNSWQGLWESTNTGANWTRLIATATTVHRFGAETWTQNEQRGFFWAQPQVNNPSLLTTDDAFATTDTATGTGLGGDISASGGFPYASSQFYALTTSAIFLTIDRGETWIDKTGDWAFGFTGGKVILPVWVEEP